MFLPGRHRILPVPPAPQDTRYTRDAVRPISLTDAPVYISHRHRFQPCLQGSLPQNVHTARCGLPVLILIVREPVPWQPLSPLQRQCVPLGCCEIESPITEGVPPPDRMEVPNVDLEIRLREQRP